MPDPALRVLVVTSALVPEQLETWGCAARADGLDVHLAGAMTHDRSESYLAPLGVPDWGTTHQLEARGWVQRGRLWWNLDGLEALIERLEPDVVHVHSEAWGRLVAQALRGASPVAAHGAENVSLTHGAHIEAAFRQRMAERNIGRLAGYASWNAEGVEIVRCHGLKPGTPTVVAPAIVPDPRPYLAVEPTPRNGALRVGYIGRLVPEKGVQWLIGALDGLADARLVVVGSGPYESELVRLAERRGVELELAGVVDAADMPKVIADLDVVVVPSLVRPGWAEQFGRVVCEAMLVGVAVIASDSGSLAAVVGDGGITVPELDHRALRGALRSMIDDDDARVEWGRRGRAWAWRELVPEAAAARLVSFWREDLGSVVTVEEAQLELPPTQVAGPVVVTAISQALSAASNFVIVVALTRASGSAEVGRYILAFTVYSAALSIQRAMLTDALIARRPGATAPVRDEDNRTLTVAAAVSFTEAAVIVLIGWATGFHQLSLLGVFLVFLLMQDACRYVLFRNLRHAYAATLDGVWFLVSCTAFVILRHHGGHAVAVAVWGTGGALACFVGLGFVRFRPTSPAISLAWWRTHLWPSTRWLTLEGIFFQADQQVQAFGLTALVGSSLFGKYQQAGSLVNPAVFLTSGIALVAVTHFSRHENGQYRTAMIVSGVCFVCVALVTGLLLATSHFVVHVLYGDRTVIHNNIILATGAIYASVVSATGVHGWLRSQRSERVLPLARGIGLVVFAPVALVVARHDFVAGLWVLAAEAFVYMVIISSVGYRYSRASELVVPVDDVT